MNIMAKFGTWVPIVEGCEMPHEGEEVLITICMDNGICGNHDIQMVTDLGNFTDRGFYIPSAVPGTGFDTKNDWDEGQPIYVVAWMPKPESANVKIDIDATGAAWRKALRKKLSEKKSELFA